MPLVTVNDGLGSPISFYEIGGKYFPSMPTIEQNLAQATDLPCRNEDVMILTYPKAGTNWSWEIVNMLYTGDGQISSRQKIESMIEFRGLEQLAALPSARLLNTHLSPEFYPKDLVNRKCKVVFVQRNPKDVYVSYYHHCRKLRLYDYDGEWNGFFDLIMDGKVDYGSWFDFTKNWEAFFTQHPDIPLLRLYFEDMKMDLPAEIRKIANFLNLPCSDSYRDKVAEHCGFAVMKKEKQMPKEIQEAHFKCNDNPMFRKGIVGDWKNHFTVAQNERFDAEYKKQMTGFTFKFEQYMKS